jgi:heat shock protein HslJ
MKTYKIMSVVVMLALMLTACAAPTPAAVQPEPTAVPVEPTTEPSLNPEALADSQWQLDSLIVNGQVVTFTPATLPTIEFDTEGKIAGKGGCNSYFADYTLTGGEISFGAIGATKMACAEGMDQETQYFAALETAKQISLTPETSLELRSDDGKTEIKFVNMPVPNTPDETGLTGKVWELTQIENTADGTVEAPATDVVPTLEFTEDGKISGNGGCNGFGGLYATAEGNKVTFTEIISTLMACDNTDIETVYFNGLNEAESYAFDGDMLKITASGGAVVMTFTASTK